MQGKELQQLPLLHDSIAIVENPLYRDNKILINYWPKTGDEHVVQIGDNTYRLQRGILEEFARAPRGELERLIRTVDDIMLFDLKKQGVSIDGFHIGVCQAYHKSKVEYFENTIKDLRDQI